MPYSLDFNIREQLASYLAKAISLREFEDWFFPETWDVDQLRDLALMDLVYGIKLRLAEFSHRDWTENELRSLLRPFIEKFDIDNLHTRVRVQYGTSSINTRVQSTTRYSGQFVDIKFSTVFV